MQVELFRPRDGRVDDFVDDVLLEIFDIETTLDLANNLLAGLVDDAVPVRRRGQRGRNVADGNENDDRVFAFRGSTGSREADENLEPSVVRSSREQVLGETHEGSWREGTLT